MRPSTSSLSIRYGGYDRTSSGATAGRIARKRPCVPILVATTSVADWVLCEEVQTYEQTARGAAGGDRGAGNGSVVIAGIPLSHAATTNDLRVVLVS